MLKTGEDGEKVLPEMGAEQQADSLDEVEVAIGNCKSDREG